MGKNKTIAFVLSLCVILVQQGCRTYNDMPKPKYNCEDCEYKELPSQARAIAENCHVDSNVVEAYVCTGCLFKKFFGIQYSDGTNMCFGRKGQLLEVSNYKNGLDSCCLSLITEMDDMKATIEMKIDEDTLGWKWGKEFKITGIKIDKNGDFKVEIRRLKSSLCPEIFIFDKKRNFKGGCIEI